MTLSDQSRKSDDEDAEAADESDSGSIEDSDEEEGGDEDSDSDSDGDEGGESLNVINNARKALSGGALAALVSSKPITSDTQVHHNIAHTIPAVTRPSETLNIIPKTTNKEILLTALREVKDCEEALCLQLMRLQAANILNEAYCKRLRNQLAHKEGKEKESGVKGKLVRDGLPCLLSGDEFYECMVEFDVAQRQEERARVERLHQREGRTAILAEWKKVQDERTKAIKERKAEWELEKKQWVAEKAVAKAAKKWFGKPEPRLGKLLPASPRPKMTAMTQNNEEDEEGKEEL